MSERDEDPRRPLLTPRTALVLLLAVLVSVVTAALTVLSGRSMPEAVVVGSVTLGASIRFFDWLISAP